jgi:hypothetical protein
MFLLIISVFGCKSPSNDQTSELLDSLKREYAGKTVHLTFTNNEAGTAPITSQYAYVDREKSDLAFELKQYQTYQVAFEEGIPFVPTTKRPVEDKPDMILIEIPNTGKRGFVSYKLIKEFNRAWAF